METQREVEEIVKVPARQPISEVTPNIPVRILKKLAKVAGLVYREGEDLGGGLCLKLGGLMNRRRALAALGALLNAGMGEGKTDRALESVGAGWLDVVGWCEEDAEYAALWEGMERVRLKAASAAAFDKLMDRAINGYDAQEARTTREGVEVVTVRKYDNTMAVNLLKSVGYVGVKAEPTAAKKGGGKKVEEAPKEEAKTPEVTEVTEVPPEAEETGEVMYGDRESAFRAMGRADDGGASERPAPRAAVSGGRA